MSAVHFFRHKLLDPPDPKGYISIVECHAGQLRILGAAARESIMISQEVIASPACTLGNRAQGSAPLVLAGHVRKYRGHSLIQLLLLRPPEKRATSAKCNFLFQEWIELGLQCRVAPAECAEAAWRNLYLWCAPFASCRTPGGGVDLRSPV